MFSKREAAAFALYPIQPRLQPDRRIVSIRAHDQRRFDKLCADGNAAAAEARLFAVPDHHYSGFRRLLHE
jgi:hypothetical protein